MGLSSVVLTPFIGAHDLLSVSHRGRPVEALSKRVFDQSSRRSVVSIDPAVDILQQPPPLFDADAML
jgi:hypothetical protein